MNRYENGVYLCESAVLLREKETLPDKITDSTMSRVGDFSLCCKGYWLLLDVCCFLRTAPGENLYLEVNALQNAEKSP